MSKPNRTNPLANFIRTDEADDSRRLELAAEDCGNYEKDERAHWRRQVAECAQVEEPDGLRSQD